MSLGQIKSPEETTEPAFLENISLVVCPFLGLKDDPGTSLGFAHAANQCYRLEKRAGIDLAHQNRYCLGANYTHCYVYGQSKTRSKSIKTASTLPSPTPDDSKPELTGEAPKKRTPNQARLRLSGLLLMLLLIIVAAIIWWPPPGSAVQDFVVLGSSITKEITGSEEVSPETYPLEPAPLDNPAAAAGKSVGLVENSALDESTGQTIQEGPEKGPEAVDEQAKTAEAQLVSAEDANTSGESSVAGAEGAEDKPEFDNPVADYETIMADTAVDDEDTGVEEQTAVEEGESDTQASTRQSDASEQAKQVEAEEVVESEPEDVSGSETDDPDAAPEESEPAGSPTAVTTTYIGPVTGAAGLQGASESSQLLFLLQHPGDGAEVLAIIPERQPATVLGRSSDGEWLLVRLASGVEGWVNARESGASIIISNLPVLDNVSGDASAVQDPGPPAASVEQNRAPLPEVQDAPSYGTAVINSGALNLRAGPGLEYDSIGVGYNGQQVALLEQPAGKVWIQIRLPNGTQGWVNSNYLILTG